MAITRNEAAAALSDIESTTRRGLALRGYRGGGPILMMWSVIWAVGYVAMGLLPQETWGMVWFPLDVVGVVGSIVLGRGARGPAGSGVAGVNPAAVTCRMLGAMVAIMAFVSAVFTIFRPTDPAVAMAFPGLLIGVIYTVVGFWQAPRYIAIGVVMFVLTLVGFFLFKPYLAFWMASASIALFISGVWLWRR
jgi:hypothetical protein